LPEGTVGEIVVSGPSVCRHYWEREGQKPTTDESLLGAAPVLRTGDLGFRWDGELFITGRRKNTIIIRGVNLSCEGVEEVAQAAHPAIYSCLTAAVSLDDGKEEQLIIMQEAPAEATSELDTIVGNIRENIAAYHGVQVHDVVLVETRSLPRTTSGKVRRKQALERYQSGALRRL
jgi:acyl-CoA synthetase (AMP-forming)/AMP-acid ligase II